MSCPVESVLAATSTSGALRTAGPPSGTSARSCGRAARSAATACALLGLLVGCGRDNVVLAALAVPPASMIELRRVDLPNLPLRGYGALAGDYREYGTAVDDVAVSILVISCAGADKAGIVLGKCRSDLGSLGGVEAGTIAIGEHACPVSALAGQGEIAAARAGSTVVVVAGKSRPALLAAIRALDLAHVAGLDVAGVAAPAYLDKFDRWGFGFWFTPLRTPEKQEATYDVRERFDWAKRMGVGLQIDAQLNQSTSAEGLLDDHGKRWGIELARDLGLPVTIQMQSGATPDWIAQRYADEMMQKAPQYVGSWYGINGNNGFPGGQQNHLGFASVAGKDRLFADQYQAVRRYHALPNVTAYGEWHGELNEGALALFLDSGPVADARYRDYLRERYQTPAAVDRRWSGGAGAIRTWTDVRMPEPADFLGWNERAVDLHGEWRLCFHDRLADADKERWGDPALDDSAWRRLIAPGDDRQIYKERWRVPTVFRRHVALSDGELARLTASKQTFLYALTLEAVQDRPVMAVVNGTALPPQRLNTLTAWVVFDVTGLLHAGDNLVALSLPWGEMSYRTYLTTDAPRCYPGLGKEQNSRWVDYRDFIAWMREDSMRRSIEAIRREDPDKFIKLMSPGAVSDLVKALAEDYGCYFHDPGGMAAMWIDTMQGQMRSSELPVSAEPSAAAGDLPALKVAFGRWLAEGVQAVDYFPDIGDILWRPDQKAWFEAHQPIIHLVGKYHFPDAQVAVLEGARAQRLTGFPWDQINTPLLWSWRRGGVGTYGRVPNPRAIIYESDIMRGTVGRFRVIADDATLIMDEALIARIEAWVRDGGVFIAQGQSGRHTPEVADAWPIARLTGYRVIGGDDNSRVGPVPGQPIFTDPRWTQTDPDGTPVVGGAGVYLEKVAPECQDILTWGKGGPVAMGVRPLGKGKVVTLGTEMPHVENAWSELLAWCGVAPTPAPSAPDCRVSAFVSNNGLYDVYVLWAEGVKAAGTVALTVPGRQTTMRDLSSGATVTGATEHDAATFRVRVEPNETYAFLAPRAVPEAPLAWLRLQRQWWKGTKAPAPAPVPAVAARANTLSLDEGWAFKPLPADATPVAPLIATAVDDSAWPRMDIGIWYGTAYPDTRRGVFRKRFTVPAGWATTEPTWLWIRGSEPSAFLPPYQCQAYLDGQPVYDSGGWTYASCTVDVSDRLTPGEHQLAIVTASATPVGGIPGNVWLEHLPRAIARQPLDGDWGGVTLPGEGQFPPGGATREITPLATMTGKRALLFIDGTKNNIIQVIIDGRILERDLGGQHLLMDLTPYLHPDRASTIWLNSQFGPPNATGVKTIELRYCEAGAY